MNDDKITQDARSVTKGLKKKEIDDMMYRVNNFLAIFGGVLIGFIFKNFFIGLVAFIIFGYLSYRSWYKE